MSQHDEPIGGPKGEALTYQSLLFKGGYLITDIRTSRIENESVNHVLSRWKKTAARSYLIFCDPAVDLHEQEDGETKIVLIGRVLDPINNEDRISEILAHLLGFYRKSENYFFDYLDKLTGRFVLLLASPTRNFVLQDATGNRSLFYNNRASDLIISSHIQLIADIKGHQIPEERRAFIASKSYQSHVRHFPGTLTPYIEIDALTPNTLLGLDEFRVARFFPRDRFVRRKLSGDLIDEISSILTRQIKLLSTKQPLGVSLTGGIDSRLTLATSRELKDSILYYTFATDRNSFEQRDAELAQKICRDVGVRHLIIRGIETPISDEDHQFLQVFRRNTAFMRADRQGMIAKALHEQYPHGHLHLKSNVSELGKGLYRSKEYFLPGKANPQMLAHLYGTNAKSGFCVAAFQDFIKRTDLKHAVSMGYDIYDLFHWEHRLGCWQALQLLDFDMSQDTMIPYNNRYLLGKMMSIEPAKRHSHALYFSIIRHVWPEVLQFPCNPWQKKGLLTKFMRRIARGLYWRIMTTVHRSTY